MNTTKGKETKEHILSVCRELFYENGYKATTARMIAARADINLGLLNYYFKGKNDIGSTVYFEIRDGYNQLIESTELCSSEVDRFLYSSAIELYLCLVNPNFATYYLDMLNEANVHDRLQNFIIMKIQKLGIHRDNPAHAQLSSISLSSVKPALVRHSLTAEDKLPTDHYILYYLEQQLACFGKPAEEAQSYLDVLKTYHIDIAKNFTPILVKIK